MKEEIFHQLMHCPICNGESTLIDLVKTINPNSNKKIELRECNICKHWYHNPMPAQEYLSYLYESASEFVVSKGYKNDMQQIGFEKKNILTGFGSWLYNHEKKHSGHKYLEIGVGSGFLFRFFKNQGYDCHGIDPGNWNSSLKLFPNIDSLPYDNYDIIVLSDVLEHLENPLLMLQNLKKKTMKSTRIYCSFPNKGSLPARIKKSSWAMVRPLGHLHYFSEKSVFTLFNKAGLRIKELKKVNALHNELFSSLNPIIVLKKILNIPNCWKDQFWVKALSGQND